MDEFITRLLVELKNTKLTYAEEGYLALSSNCIFRYTSISSSDAIRIYQGRSTMQKTGITDDISLGYETLLQNLQQLKDQELYISSIYTSTNLLKLFHTKKFKMLGILCISDQNSETFSKFASKEGAAKSVKIKNGTSDF